MVYYTEDETIELNKQLRKLQIRAKRLILSDYYDSVRLNEIQSAALNQLTNASSHKNINAYLWNSGIIEKTLDFISEEIKTIRKLSK